MDNGLIPHRYAKALWKFAQEHGETDAVYATAKQVIASFKANPGLMKALSNPFVKAEEKESLLLSAAGAVSCEAYRRFVKLILEHRREDFALAMMYAYRDIYRSENHIVQAHITTAAVLDKTQMDKLKNIVKNGFKGSDIEFSESVDSSIIGGFVIDVDSVRMDASLSNELEQLRQTLLRSN